MASQPSAAPPMDYQAMAISALVSAGVAYGAYMYVGAPVATSFLGGSELASVFVGLGVATLVGPLVAEAVSSQSMPIIPSPGKQMAMNFLYGGAIGTAIYYGWNMIMPQYSPGIDVALSAAVSGVVAPYLSFMPSY